MCIIYRNRSVGKAFSPVVCSHRSRSFFIFIFFFAFLGQVTHVKIYLETKLNMFRALTTISAKERARACKSKTRVQNGLQHEKKIDKMLNIFTFFATIEISVCVAPNGTFLSSYSIDDVACLFVSERYRRRRRHG